MRGRSRGMWQRLQSSDKEEVIKELILVCEDIIYEHIRFNQQSAPNPQGDNLRQAVNTTTSDLKPRESSYAARTKRKSA